MKNPQRSFDDIQIEYLGDYVYALKNPLDEKIFYVGVGVEHRIFHHFNEADEVRLGKRKPTKKTSKILEIWDAGYDVDWFIVAHSLPERNQAFQIEAALIDVFRDIPGLNEILNEQGGHHSTKLNQEDLVNLSAPFVNPNLPYSSVFLFLVQNAFSERGNIYESTRGYWQLSKKYNNLTNSFAVGIINNISKSSYKIDTWYKEEKYNKYAFESPGHPSPEFHQEFMNKNWSKIIAPAKGFWQRGQYLIVEFDGNGKFRIIRGLKESDKWFDCA